MSKDVRIGMLGIPDDRGMPVVAPKCRWSHRKRCLFGLLALPDGHPNSPTRGHLKLLHLN